ncbi:unnamed protein product [Ectocarpus fasciculatus]
MSFVMLVGVAASPASVISYLPRCFFGSLLILIAVDLMVEWLWQARLRMMPAEYLVCLATFCSIQAWGVEKGMVAGLVLAALSFTVTYAQVPTVMTARVKASTVMRTFEERVILKAHQEQTVVLELQGYIFFGSAVKILSDVKDRIVWGTDPPPAPNAGAPATGIFGNVYDDSNYSTKNVGHPYQQQQQQQQPYLETAALVKPGGGGEGTGTGGAMNPRGDILSPVFNRSGAVYRSSPATAAAAAAAAAATSVLPESSPLRWRTPRQARSQSLREHTSTSSQQQGGPSSSSQGRPSPLAQSLGRTRSAGATTTSAVAGGGGDGGRPFHRAGGLLPGASEQQEAEQQQPPAVPANSSSSSSSSRRGGGSGGAKFSVSARETTGYGAMEEGGAGGDGGASGSGGGAAAAAGVRVRRPRGASLGEEPRVGEGAVQAYMSLWANGGGGSLVDSPGLTGMTGGGGDSSPGFSGRMGRSSSVVSLLPASEERTRRVILDFSNVVRKKK